MGMTGLKPSIGEGLRKMIFLEDSTWERWKDGVAWKDGGKRDKH